MITDNIIDVEADAIVALIAGLADPGMVFMDFGTAFPSLFHEWMLFVFGRMGLPVWLVTLIKHVYAPGGAGVVYKGRQWRRILVMRGVRQGCPASGVLFVLCCDPLFRRLAIKVVGPRGSLRALADDLAFVSRDSCSS